MAATEINGITTSCLRIEILVDSRDQMGCKSGKDVADVLRHLADRFEAGEGYFPGCTLEDEQGNHYGPCASVDWL
jgi:hypothetical protein